MKKFTKILTLIVGVFALTLLFGCGKNSSNITNPKSNANTSAKSENKTTEMPVQVLSHSEYLTAEKGEDIVIEAYVQGKQIYNAWGNTSLYLQDDDGGYYVYRWSCTQAEYDEIEIGDKIRVSGEKAEWSGEHGIGEGTAVVKKLDAEQKFYSAFDCTDLLGTDELIAHQNEFVKFTALQVVEISATVTDPETQAETVNKGPFLYNWDGSGERGSDVYFNVTDGKNTYQFLVESDLCTKDSDVYKMAEELEIGDFINVEAFAYWYNGINPHVTSIEKIDFVDHAGYVAAKSGDLIIFEAYVQAKQIYTSWNNTSLYLADEDGGYFVYRWNCTKDEYDAINVGDKVRVYGEKSAWAGQNETAEGTAKVFKLDETLAPYSAINLTESFGNVEEAYQVLRILFNNLEVVLTEYTVEDPETKERTNHTAPFTYRSDNSGDKGDDIYFTLSNGSTSILFVVESDLCGMDTDVYKAVEGLKVGDKVNVEAFAYWYNGLNPHTVSITVLEPTE